ncbi:cytochrome c [Chlorobium sp. BLA1]|uniref:cytochrome c n=1 Tax=Candidatus Chlorobium masyuteum TaxID=2716876 RepID=UPI00141FC1AE|nr:cytochrome c [Candidatus Chlorobium masyuteum]NHQ60416.1 cytochrome c [Candidatus Chlorobium masyuteum]
MKKIMSICVLSGFLSGLSPASMTAATLSGEAIFNRNCSVCHSVAPPPKSAPPIIPLSNRYHLQFHTKKEGVNHIVAYLKAPSKAKAVDPQAITRFGLMPPLRLPDAELSAVAEWVWDQYNPNMGMGRGMGQGMGRKW